MTTFSNGAAQSTTLTWTGVAMPTLATGGYSAPSDLFDNTVAGGPGGFSYLRGLVRLSFTSVSATTGAPYLTMFLLAALDGTNLPSPPGNPGTGPAAPFPNQRQIIRQLVPSAAFSIVDFGDPDGFDLGPFKYAVQFYNQSGASIAAPVVTLQRYNALGA